MSESMIQMQRKLADVTAQLEKAEAELAKLAKQEPVATVEAMTNERYVQRIYLNQPLPEGTKLFTGAVPAVAAPAVPEEWRNFVMQVATPPAVYLDYPKIGAQEPPVKCRHWRCRSCMCAWSENEEEWHAKNCRYVQARALLQSAPAAPAPSVPEEWKAQILAAFPLLDDTGLCEEEHHCEWTLQQDRKRLHTLLQPAPTGEPK